ncbi:MAG: type II toxin-antitoxin system HicB family antitoxin [Verrucomicrobiota bacterium]
MSTQYVVYDGDLTLHLEPAEEGGYTVTTPIDSQLVTEADSIEEAFEMARDALEALAEARKELARQDREKQVA